MRLANIPWREKPEFTLWSMFEDALGGEAVESIAISDALFCPDTGDDEKVGSGNFYSVDSAKALLSYDPKDVHEPGMNAVYVWTATRVLFVHNYDGFININGVPRHPDASALHSNGERLS